MPIKLSPRFSVGKAHAAQVQLSKQVIREDVLPETISCVAGVDVAYAKGMSIGAVAVLDFASLKIIESRTVCVKTRFPYIPTLLSYREIPPAHLAIRKLQVRPDVFLVDGQGIAHPYRLGFASHLGLVADAPTIGVAKSLLCGEVGSFGDQRWAPITDRGEIVGAAVISKPGCKPVYVSVGHRFSLKRAVSIVVHCTRAYRIPEPIRRAHILAGEEKRKLAQLANDIKEKQNKVVSHKRGTILDPRLKKIVNKIKDKSLRSKVAELLENPSMEIDGKVYVGLSLESSPAGISRHHSYPGGFVEHVVSTTEIALTLCDVVKKVYRGKVDRDLVVSGALLHDIFKPLTYRVEKNGTYRSTPLAERLDHLTLIVSELVRRDFPLNLIHIVCAHHGGKAGPMWPRTIEALICHLADITDSRLNGEVLRAARHLSKQATGEELDILSSKEAFEIVRSKTVEGWDAVKKSVEKMRQRRLNTRLES